MTQPLPDPLPEHEPEESLAPEEAAGPRDAPRTGRYGIDAPGIVRMFLIGGGAAALVAIIGFAAGSPGTISSAALGIALVALGEGGWMLYSSKVAKLRERVRVVDLAELAPTAIVLDVGCGRGLLLTEAARRVPHGLAVGIDVWSEEDLSKNSAEEAAKNAAREGVSAQVEIRTADVREIPFADEFFDAVITSMTLHNIREADGRAQAVREMVRVLRPGGRIVILDMAKTEEHVVVLGEAGLLGVDRGPRVWRMFPPVRYVTGSKPPA